jgi:Ca-activated chloride channel family protein
VLKQRQKNKQGMRIITGLGTEKGGTIPLKKNGVVQSSKRQ